MWHRGHFCGESTVNNVARGAVQSGHVGYWVDERWAGQGFIPEALVAVFGHAFDRAGLHRLEISIIPRNHSSRRVVEKLGIRHEGLAQGYLKIAGVWEDHMRFGITSEEWAERREELWQFVSMRRLQSDELDRDSTTRRPHLLLLAKFDRVRTGWRWGTNGMTCWGARSLSLSASLK